MRHDGEQPAALQPSALARRAPKSEPDRFSRARQEPGMENNSGSLPREGVFINIIACDDRCVHRNLFGLAISPQTPLMPLVEAIGARPASCAHLYALAADSPIASVACTGRLYASFAGVLYKVDKRYGGRHAGQDFSTTSAPPRPGQCSGGLLWSARVRSASVSWSGLRRPRARAVASYGDTRVRLVGRMSFERL